MLDFTIELKRTNELLERIAVAIERVSPPIPEELLNFKKRGPESIRRYGDDEALWAREQFHEMIHGQGLSGDQEEAILDETMKGYVASLDDRDGRN